VREQETIVARWVPAVKRGIASGSFRANVDPRMATMSIADVVLGAYRFMKPVGRCSPDYVTEQLTAMILEGLSPR
jgi:hypothetical protein